MKGLLLVFLGSGLGGCIRYLISLGFRQAAPSVGFPWGTFTANLMACLLAGFLAAKMHPQQEDQRIFWLAGFCGGFSTFSAFSMESIQLIRSGLWLPALSYLLLSLVCGMAGVLIFLRST